MWKTVCPPTQVRKLDGINIVGKWNGDQFKDTVFLTLPGKLYLITNVLLVSVDNMKRNVAVVTVQNRAARALANLAMDPESSALIHSAGNCPSVILDVLCATAVVYKRACSM